MDTLPNEILFQIAKFVSINKIDFGNLRLVSTVFWKLLCRQYFDHLVVCGTCTKQKVFYSDHIACLRLISKRDFEIELRLNNYLDRCIICNLNVVKFLSNTTDHKDGINNYTITKAFKKGSAEVIKYLIDTVPDFKVWTYSFFNVIKSRHLETIKLVLTKFERSIEINKKHIIAAIKTRDYEIFEYLYCIYKNKKKSDPNAICIFFRDEFVKCAAKHGIIRIVKYIFNEIGNNLIKSSCSRILLDTAIYYGHLEIMKFAIENGAEVYSINNESNYYYTPLERTAIHGWFHLVEYLISCNAKMDVNNPKTIQLAISNKHYHIAKLLMEKFHIPKLLYKSHTAMSEEVKKEYVDILNILTSKGYTIEMQ